MRARDSETNLMTSDSKLCVGRGALLKWPQGARRPQLHLQAEEHRGQGRDKAPGRGLGKLQSLGRLGFGCSRQRRDGLGCAGEGGHSEHWGGCREGSLA